MTPEALARQQIDPDRPMADQVADHDAVRMPFADRDLVDANGLGSRCTSPLELGLHVLLVQCLDRIPVQMHLFGNFLDARRATAPTHVVRKALCIERIVGQQRQPLTLHRRTRLASNPAYFHVQVNPEGSAGQIPYLPTASVIEAAMGRPAGAAARLFARRDSSTIRTSGSPKRPRTVALARKPGKQYPSTSRRREGVLDIDKPCQIRQSAKHARMTMIYGTSAATDTRIRPH
jgi:hypothetical protein